MSCFLYSTLTSDIANLPLGDIHHNNAHLLRISTIILQRCGKVGVISHLVLKKGLGSDPEGCNAWISACTKTRNNRNETTGTKPPEPPERPEQESEMTGTTETKIEHDRNKEFEFICKNLNCKINTNFETLKLK